MNVNVYQKMVAVVENNMRNITYLHYSRVYTPKNSSSASQLEAGDINQDGVVDILDLSEIAAFDLKDFNNDGIIDILDAAEYLANPGGIPVVEPPPPPPPPEPEFDVQRCCDEHYPEGHWAFYTTFGRLYERRCREFKDPTTKITSCLPCNSTPLEEAVCKACATIPDKTPCSEGIRLVEIFLEGQAPTNPAVKLGKGKAKVEQDGVKYEVWCESIACVMCTECTDYKQTTWAGEITGCATNYTAPYAPVPMFCPEYGMYHSVTGSSLDSQCFPSQAECISYHFKRMYPYPYLESPEQLTGKTGAFLTNGLDKDTCKCADMTQDYDPCRYGATIMQCIGDNTVDPGPDQ